jgi:hypothetical protein
LNGRGLELNLDHPDFLPFFETAAELSVPIYIHPQLPQRAMQDAYYAGRGEPLDAIFSGGG